MRKQRPHIVDELRLNSDKTIDEVVIAHPDLVHLEQMADDHWWLGINKGDKQLCLSFYVHKRQLKVIVQEDSIGCREIVTDVVPEQSS